MEYKGLILIAAVSENGVIGLNGEIPWRFSKDMKHFKELTWGHPVIMGRKTYSSIPKKFRPLEDRTNIVVTRDRNYDPRGVMVRHSVEDAIKLAREIDEIQYVAGGGEIYRQTLPHANIIELTKIHIKYPGDVKFPDVDWNYWFEVKDRREVHGLFSFHTYRRKIRD